jgi:hypothetical protein
MQSCTSRGGVVHFLRQRSTPDGRDARAARWRSHESAATPDAVGGSPSPASLEECGLPDKREAHGRNPTCNCRQARTASCSGDRTATLSPARHRPDMHRRRAVTVGTTACTRSSRVMLPVVILLWAFATIGANIKTASKKMDLVPQHEGLPPAKFGVVSPRTLILADEKCKAEDAARRLAHRSQSVSPIAARRPSSREYPLTL